MCEKGDSSNGLHNLISGEIGKDLIKTSADPVITKQLELEGISEHHLAQPLC